MERARQNLADGRLGKESVQILHHKSQGHIRQVHIVQGQVGLLHLLCHGMGQYLIIVDHLAHGILVHVTVVTHFGKSAQEVIRLTILSQGERLRQGMRPVEG